MTDVEQLLRDTLHGRAATVTDAPPLPDRAEVSGSRSRWLLVAATVALVLAAGGGAAVWGLRGGRSGQQSGGGYPRACAATLPAAWRSALAAPRETVRGYSSTVVAVTPYGDVVVWTGPRDAAGVGLRPVDRPMRALYTAPAGWSLDTSVDGAELVLSLSPARTGTVGPDVTDIVVIDLRTGAVRHLLRASGVPRGTVVADRAASVLDGTVYWTAIPRGTVPGRTTGAIVAYDVRRARATVIGHGTNLETLPEDPRGVLWDGGRVLRRDLPAAVPRTRPVTFGVIVTDSMSYAWIPLDRPTDVYSVDGRGDEHSWTLPSGAVPGRPSVVAVSGPFVILEPTDYGNPQYFVLDTRSGALAATDVRATGGGAARVARLVVGTQTASQAPFTSLVLDTAKLPELRCR